MPDDRVCSPLFVRCTSPKRPGTPSPATRLVARRAYQVLKNLYDAPLRERRIARSTLDYFHDVGWEGKKP